MLGVAASLVIVGGITGPLLRALFRENTPGSEAIFLVLGVFVFSILMIPVLLLLQTTTDHFAVYLLILVCVCLICVLFLLRKLNIAINEFLNPIGNVVLFYLVVSVVIAILLLVGPAVGNVFSVIVGAI